MRVHEKCTLLLYIHSLVFVERVRERGREREREGRVGEEMGSIE